MSSNDSGVEESFDNVSLISTSGSFWSSLPPSFDGPCLQLSWVKVNDLTYRHRICVVMRFEGTDELLPQFGYIENVFQNENGEILFVCKRFRTYGFYNLFHAYELAWTSKLECVVLKNLVTPFPVILHHMGNGSIYDTVKH